MLNAQVDNFVSLSHFHQGNAYSIGNINFSLDSFVIFTGSTEYYLAKGVEKNTDYLKYIAIAVNKDKRISKVVLIEDEHLDDMLSGLISIDTYVSEHPPLLINSIMSKK